MADLIGTSVATTYNQTTNTYATANGEWYYPLVASESGTGNTLKITMNNFNTTTNLKLIVRDSVGVLLASGVIAAAGGTGVRSVVVTDFAVTVGQTYLLGIVANTGSPRPMQNTTVNTVKSQAASTYAATQPTLTLPGTDSAVRQYHMWVEGTGLQPTITDVNTDETVVISSTGNTLTVANFDGTINSITVGGKAATSVAGSGTSYTFSLPGFTDGQTYPEPDSTQSLVATDNTSDTDSIDVTLTSPEDHDSVVILNAIDNNAAYIGYHFTLNDDDKLIYPTEGGDFVVSAEGGVTTTEEGVRILWHWNTSTEIMTQLNLTINDAGVLTFVGFGRIPNSIGIGMGI